MTAAELDRRAERDVRHAVEAILDRAGCRISHALAGEIHQAYAGRGWTRGRVIAYCPNHPYTRMPCGLCVRGV